MEDSRLTQLKAILEASKEGLTRTDFTRAFQAVIKLVTAIESKLIDKIDARLAKIKDGIDGRNGRDGRDGKDGRQGVPGFRGETGARGSQGEPGNAGKDGKNGSPDTAEDIRNKLELLDGEERLDAKFIKNLPTNDGITRVIGGRGSLWALEDVDVSGIAVGQSLKWDGTRWIPFTPTGGGTTSVYNEVVSGSGTSFTLGSTPVVGTERLYANGQRLTPTVDYTISGSGITTVSSWAAGSITADYEK